VDGAAGEARSIQGGTVVIVARCASGSSGDGCRASDVRHWPQAGLLEDRGPGGRYQPAGTARIALAVELFTPPELTQAVRRYPETGADRRPGAGRNAAVDSRSNRHAALAKGRTGQIGGPTASATTARPSSAYRSGAGRKARASSHTGQGSNRERATERACTDCGTTKPLSTEFFLPISSGGFYGCCRVCRNKRARERYHSTPEIRAAEIARSQKNNRLRCCRSSALTTLPGSFSSTQTRMQPGPRLK
jgi:hypothetical protein